jgi:uncharacterized RDD family membrane protein YckC
MPCAACGRENSPDARFCQACGGPLQLSASPQPPHPQPQPARLGDRLLAVILDTLLLAAAFAAAGMWAAARWGGLTANGFQLTGVPALLTMAVALLLGFFYYWLLEALFGATLGKAIVGIAVSAADGARCGMRRSLIRNLLRIVDGLGVYLVGFLVAVLSRQRQRLGDHLAGTYVLERGIAGPWRALLVAVWLAGIGAGLWGAVAFHTTPPTTEVTAPTDTKGTGARIEDVATPAPSALPILISGDLKLADFAFLEGSDGPPRSPKPYKPEERLFLSFKVTGLTTDSEGRFHLTYGVEGFDPNGVLLQKVSRELDGTPGASNTATISAWFDIPRCIPPGAARVRALAHDKVKNTEGELTAPFIVEAPAPAVSTQLEIRRLRLSLSENGPPLEPPVLSSGSTLYLAGELAGMQFRADDVDVGIAFQVLDPAGNTVIDKPDFLQVKDSLVYHPPSFHVPITAHLRLPSDAAKGAYRERYVVTDRIAGVSKTYELPFTLQ